MEMEITSSSTVAKIAIDYPNTLQVFEKYGIDYCCNGHQPLETACRAAGVTTVSVLDEIQAATKDQPRTGVIDLRFLPPSALIDYIIRKHHEYTSSEMVEIANLLEKICQAHGHNHPELHELKEVFEQEKGNLTKHLKREELQVFPFIKYLEKVSEGQERLTQQRYQSFDEVWGTVGDEHAQTGKNLEVIRKLTNNFAIPGDACMSYIIAFNKLEMFINDLHQHVHLENNILHPMAEALFHKVYGSQKPKTKDPTTSI